MIENSTTFWKCIEFFVRHSRLLIGFIIRKSNASQKLSKRATKYERLKLSFFFFLRSIYFLSISLSRKHLRCRLQARNLVQPPCFPPRGISPVQPRWLQTRFAFLSNCYHRAGGEWAKIVVETNFWKCLMKKIKCIKIENQAAFIKIKNMPFQNA